MNKVILEFDSIPHVIKWAKAVAADPEQFVGGEAASSSKKPEKESTKKKEETKTETPATTEGGKSEVPQILVDIKEAGVKLTDMQPTRYEGVQLVLAKYGVTKIKELKEEDQPKVLKMFNKMIEADKTAFAEMLEYLKD